MAWAALVRRHDEILRAAIQGQRGVVVKTEGDAFFAVFDASVDAITAAVAAQRAIATEPWADQLKAEHRIAEQRWTSKRPVRIASEDVGTRGRTASGSCT